MKFSKSLTALGLLVIFGSAQAQVLELQFVDTNGVTAKRAPADKYINPTGVIQVAAAAGLDRKIRLSVYNASNQLVSTQTSGVIGASNRINVNGQEYLGVFQQVTLDEEGEYRFVSETLSSSDQVVRTDDYLLVVDTTKPIINGDFVWSATGYTRRHDDGQWILSRAQARLAGFSDVSDDNSGLDKAFFSATYLDGELAGTQYADRIPANLTHDGMVIIGNGTEGSITGLHIPNPWGEAVWRFEVADRAGNIAQKEAKVYIAQARPSAPEPFAVWDGSENKLLNEDSLTGFIPYTPGMTVYSNPIKMLYRVNRQHYIGGGGRADIYGGYQLTNNGHHSYGRYNTDLILHKDSQYMYMLVEGATTGSVFDVSRRSIFHPTGYRPHLFNHNVVFGDDSLIPPNATRISAYVEGLAKWIPASFRITKADTGSIDYITKVKVEAEPRPYNQTFHTNQTRDGRNFQVHCVIPANQNECIADVRYEYPGDDVSVYHSRPILTSEDGVLRGNEIVYTWRWDGSIAHLDEESVTHNEATKSISYGVINQYKSRTWSDAYVTNMRLRFVDATNVVTEIPSVSITNLDTAKGIDAQIYQAQFKYDAIKDGVYSVYATFEDGLRTGGSRHASEALILSDLRIDATAPVISFNDSQTQIETLDDITINVSDALDASPQIRSINLQGGPASENVNLSWRAVGEGSYKLEYPVMFPSMSAGENYTLTVVAEDASGNRATVVKQFSYNPPLIDLNAGGRVIAVPAVGRPVLNGQGRPAIYTSPILIDGAPVQGSYEIMATLRSDAGSAAVLNGVTVSPGETVMLPAFDFSSSGGRLQLSVHAVDMSKAVSLPLLLQSTAPSSPTVMATVQSFVPKVTFNIPQVSVLQGIEPLSVSMTLASDNVCEIIANGEVRQSYDFVEGRRCYLEATNATFNNDSLIRNGNVLTTEAYINTPQTLTIGYEVVIYSGVHQERLVLSQYAREVTVRPAAGAVTHTLSANKGNLLHRVAQSELSLVPTSDLQCRRFTTVQSEAILLAQKGAGDLTCHVAWDGHADLTPVDNNQVLRGEMQTLGAQPVGWVVSVFTVEGTRIELERRAENVTVVAPAVPGILSYEVTFRDAGVTSSLEEVIYHNVRDEVSQVRVHVVPQNYVQQVSVLGGVCQVPVGEAYCDITKRYIPNIAGPVGSQTHQGVVDAHNGYFNGNSVRNLLINHDSRSATYEQLVYGRDVDNSVTINGQTFALGDDEFFVVMRTPHAGRPGTWWQMANARAQFALSSEFEHRSYIMDGDRYVYFSIPGLARSDGMMLQVKGQEVAGDALLLRFDASVLTDGLYHVSLSAQDAYGNGNGAGHTFNNVRFNRNAPQVKVEMLGQSLGPNTQVTFFDDLRFFAHSGWDDGTQITGVTVNGEALELVGDNPQVKGVKNRAFTPNQTVRLVVTAQNSSGNVREEAFDVSYMPVEFSAVKSHDTVHRNVETMRIAITQSRGLKCRAASSAELAVAQARGPIKGCTVEWVDLPAGLDVTMTPYRFLIEGGVDAPEGEVPVSFDVYLHNHTGERVLAYQGRETVTVNASAAPVLALSALNRLAPGVYGVPINARNVTNYEITTVPADVLLQVNGPAGQAEQGFKQRLRSEAYSLRNTLKRLPGDDLTAWSETDYTVTAYHRREPQSGVTQNIKVITLPDGGVRAWLSLESKDATDADTIVGHVKLGRYMRGETVYDVNRMGQWEARLAYRSEGAYIDISEPVMLNAQGEARIEAPASLVYQNGRQLYAVVTSKGPYPEYQREVVSSAAHVAVIKSGAIEGMTTARKLEGKVPFTASIWFEYATQADRDASKPVVWEQSQDQVSWEATNSNPGVRFLFARAREPGTTYYRVRMENKLTGEQTYSEVVRVIGYDVPRVNLSGPHTVYRGQPAVMEVTTREDVDLDASGQAQWSVDGGLSWFDGDAVETLELSETTQVMVRYRLDSTSTLVGDAGYVTANARVNVVEPLPVRLRTRGKTEAELGTELSLTGSVTHGHSRAEGELVSQWLTPGGQVIAGDALVHRIVDADMVGSDIGSFRYQAWVSGLKAETFAEQVVDVTLWQYALPQVGLSLLSRVQIAPATVVARVDVPYFYAPGVELSYEWVLPEGVEVTRTSASLTYLTVHKPGVQQIGLRVLDNRGNVREVYEFIDVVEADPMVVGMELRPSNAFMRVPVSIGFKTNGRPGHPNDRMESYRWLLNGVEQVGESRSSATLQFTEPGDYEVSVEFTSRFGQTETLVEQVSVVPNQPPVCEPFITETSSSVTVNANCKDEDGRIVSIRYTWREDGYETSGGTRLRFTKSLHERLNVIIRAVDDSGAQTTSEINWVR